MVEWKAAPQKCRPGNPNCQKELAVEILSNTNVLDAPSLVVWVSR